MSKANTRPGLLWTVLTAPLRIISSAVLTIFSAIRPYAPRLVPLLVCALFVPLILFLSATAGWVVWSNLSISWEIPLYLQYGDGIPPYAFVTLPPLNSQQRYDVSVNLLLPYTDSNVALGNFMTSLTLSTPGNKTLIHVRRPAIALPPPSRIILPSKTTTSLNVRLLDSFSAGKSNLVATVEIGRYDGWATLGSGQGREVNVISASLRGLAIPHGIRGLAIRFPLLSAFASSALFFMIVSVILGTCVLPLLLPTSYTENDGQEVKVETQWPETDIASGRGKSTETRRRRKSRNDRSSTERTIKHESPAETSIPLPPESSSRGLRRRSSKLAAKSSDDEQ